MENYIDNEEDTRKPAALPAVDNSVAQHSALPEIDDDGEHTSNGSESANQHSIVHSLAGELPFLVTHWLSAYRYDFGANGSGETIESDERKKAVSKIRQAAADLASAFTSLGSFGKSIKVRCI
jgi:hypothetical protein